MTGFRHASNVCCVSRFYLYLYHISLCYSVCSWFVPAFAFQCDAETKQGPRPAPPFRMPCETGDNEERQSGIIFNLARVYMGALLSAC